MLHLRSTPSILARPCLALINASEATTSLAAGAGSTCNGQVAARSFASRSSAHSSWGWAPVTAAATALAAALGLGYSNLSIESYADARKALASSPSGATSSNSTNTKQLPTYTREDVAKHRTKEQRIWVTYKDGVYDITDFVAMHPGGAAKIMLAAGSSVEPFWAMYQQHMKAEVQDILKEYKIGILADGGKSSAPASAPLGDPWSQEPPRHPALISRSEKPCNAETPGHILAASLITSSDVFYVRNHLPVPEVDAKTWSLHVGGEGLRNLTLDLDSLKNKFKKYSVTATVQCAGNRRNEMKAVKAVKGLDWDIGAIGTATWSGVRLRDVLTAAGLDPDDPSVSHIHFIGADSDPLSGDQYGASIPVEIALAANRDVLLAYEMNGEPLSKDHGFPVRVVVPGVVGARSVKWLTHIVASPKESSSHWQQRDYKSFSPMTDWDTVDWDSAPAIQEPPVTSAITEPMPGTQLPKGAKEVKARGYAWSGGGRDIIRVDVSSDGGKTWTTADLHKVPSRRGRAWAWSLWEATVPLPKGAQGQVQLVVKATDDSYNSQPDSVAAIWNLRGVVNNAWHRVNVEVAA